MFYPEFANGKNSLTKVLRFIARTCKPFVNSSPYTFGIPKDIGDGSPIVYSTALHTSIQIFENSGIEVSNVGVVSGGTKGNVILSNSEAKGTHYAVCVTGKNAGASTDAQYLTCLPSHELRNDVDRVVLGSTCIAKILKACDFVTKDELRPAMTGVYFDGENNRVSATDAHTLYMASIDSFQSLTQSVVVPVEVLRLLAKSKGVVTVEVSKYSTRIHGDVDGIAFVASTLNINANFPDVENVIPSARTSPDVHQLRVNVDQWKAFTTQGDKKHSTLNLLLENGKPLRLSQGVHINESYTYVPLKSHLFEYTDSKPEETFISLNAEFARKCAMAVPSKVYVSECNRAVLFEDTQTGEISLVMPIMFMAGTVEENDERFATLGQAPEAAIVPVTANEDVPVTANEDVPVTANEDVPVTANEDVPVTANEDVPVTFDGREKAATAYADAMKALSLAQAATAMLPIKERSQALSDARKAVKDACADYRAAIVGTDLAGTYEMDGSIVVYLGEKPLKSQRLATREQGGIYVECLDAYVIH